MEGDGKGLGGKRREHGKGRNSTHLYFEIRLTYIDFCVIYTDFYVRILKFT